jgi:hypothetical protein
MEEELKRSKRSTRFRLFFRNYICLSLTDASSSSGDFQNFLKNNNSSDDDDGDDDQKKRSSSTSRKKARTKECPGAFSTVEWNQLLLRSDVAHNGIFRLWHKSSLVRQNV